MLLKNYNASTITNERTTSTYNIILSDELKELMKITGETKLDKAFGIIIKDLNEDTVEISPKYEVKLNGFVAWRAYNNYYLLNNNEIILSDRHISDNCIYGCAKYVSAAYGMYKNCLIGVYGEDICLINKNGTVVNIGYLPEPEDGRDDHLDIKIIDNKLIVKVYCYYDNDWHHGGWEERIYNLDEEIERINHVAIADIFNEYFKNNKSDAWDGEYKCTLNDIYLSNRREKSDEKTRLTLSYRKCKRSRYSSDTSYGSISITAEIIDGKIVFEWENEDKLGVYSFSKLNEKDTNDKLNELATRYI